MTGSTVNNTAIVPSNGSNIIELKVVNGKIGKKEAVKYNKDGSVCKIKNNKKAGESSEVYAFKTKEEIADMLNVLNKHIENAVDKEQKQIWCRNKLLFLIGINIGIRASDLRSLKWSFFLNEDGTFKDVYILQPMKQKKYGKFVKLYFNQTVKRAVQNYLFTYPYEDIDEYLFTSRKGNEPIDVRSLWRIISNVAKEAGIKQNVGSHSLRKTWGYWCWHNAEDKNKALVIIQKCLGHSSTQVTLRYIGVQDKEIADIYYSIELGEV